MDYERRNYRASVEEEYAMSIDNLINRMQKVKRTGNGKFMACCPAHKDKTASLAITDTGDGRILLNCFAGCDTYSILKSIGLEWEDIMPESPLGHNVKSEPKVLYTTEALEIVRFEAQVICLIAYEMKNKGVLTPEMSERISKAMQTINKAIEAVK